jgi:hypothetical protein
MKEARTIELVRRMLDAEEATLRRIGRVLDEADRRKAKGGKGQKKAGIYRLWKGDGWLNLVFHGEQDVIKDDRAAELIDYLLKNPPAEGLHASVLESLVDGRPLAEAAGAIEVEGNGAGGGDGVADVGGVVEEGAGKKLMGGITLPALKEKLAELKGFMADKTLPQEEREAAEKEWRGLVRAYARGGKLGGQAGRSVDRVRKAIKAKIEELKGAEKADGKPNEVLRAFGAHLEQHLWLPSMGGKGRSGASVRAGCFIYEPPAGVVWTD